jgi:hypothetical protein
LQSFYRAGVSLEKHQSILIGKTVPQCMQTVQQKHLRQGIRF